METRAESIVSLSTKKLQAFHSWNQYCLAQELLVQREDSLSSMASRSRV